MHGLFERRKHCIQFLLFCIVYVFFPTVNNQVLFVWYFTIDTIGQLEHFDKGARMSENSTPSVLTATAKICVIETKIFRKGIAMNESLDVFEPEIHQNPP